ncbi:MAG: homoserine kinase [Bacteroidota bacterium]
MRKEATAYAPASVSNVACGFDIMGFALGDVGDAVTVRHSEARGARISTISGSTCFISKEMDKNTAGPPVVEVMKRYACGHGIEIDIKKGLPVGSGIGSSAASAMAAAVAADALLGGKLSKQELLECAIEGEKLASGSIHVDNLAPSLWGGFVLVRGYKPIDIVPIKSPVDLWCALVVPEVEIRTRESRKLIPRQVPLEDVITQTGNAAGLIAGLMSGDTGLIARSLHDRIAEPVRRNSIPGYTAVKEAALSAGALGCNISGSGPSIFALCDSESSARRSGDAMSEAMRKSGVAFSTIVSSINNSGARVVE